MEPALKYALEQWYEAVNAGDLRRAAETVGDPVVVLGPRGAGGSHRTSSPGGCNGPSSG